jgi:hypothetical protein
MGEVPEVASRMRSRMNEKQIYEAWEDCRREMDGKITLATAQEIAELKAAGKLPDTRPHVLFRHRIVAGSYDEAKRKHDMLIGCGDYGPDSLVRPYPEPGDVFGEPLELHKKHFMPFVSIHSSLLWDDVDTWLHFVTPFEPLMEDYIGSFTEPYHDFYNKEL